MGYRRFHPSSIRPEEVARELQIVWLEDIEQLTYLRQAVYAFAFRGTKPRWTSGRLVGYAVLEPAARADTPGMFKRRVFWLASHDRANQPDGVYKAHAPVEAVDPLTVGPKKPGFLTERAWGAPLRITV